MTLTADKNEPKSGFERWLDAHFEPGFFGMRFFTLVPVVLAFVGCLLMYYTGALEMWEAVQTVIVTEEAAHTAEEVQSIVEAVPEGETHAASHTSIHVIKAIDAFLLGIVLMIFSYGIYDLFVSKLDPADKPGIRPNWMKFRNISGLKVTLVEVVIIILTITFFELVLESNRFSDPNADVWTFMVIPAGVLFIALGIGIFEKMTGE